MKKIDLSKIFGSNCRTKILEKFLLEYESGNNEGFYMRLLGRELDEQINSIKRELDNLAHLGILKSKTDLRKKIFYINPAFPLISSFTEIFIQNYDPFEKIKIYFKNKPDLEVIIVNEGVQLKLLQETKSLLDIFLIGEVDKAEFNDFLYRVFYKRKIKYAIISTENFYERIIYGDKLIKNILHETGNILLKDNLNIKEKIV